MVKRIAIVSLLLMGTSSCFSSEPSSNIVRVRRARPASSARQVDSPILRVRIALPGDLNGNGIIDSSDVSALLEIYLGKRDPTAAELEAGDKRPKLNNKTYGDGRLLADDLNWLFRKFLGAETAP